MGAATGPSRLAHDRNEATVEITIIGIAWANLLYNFRRKLQGQSPLRKASTAC
jgi:hypothetical protein